MEKTSNMVNAPRPWGGSGVVRGGEVNHRLVEALADYRRRFGPPTWADYFRALGRTRLTCKTVIG